MNPIKNEIAQGNKYHIEADIASKSQTILN